MGVLGWESWDGGLGVGVLEWGSVGRSVSQSLEVQESWGGSLRVGVWGWILGWRPWIFKTFFVIEFLL